MPLSLGEHVMLLFKTLLIINEKKEVNISELASLLGVNRPQVYTLVNALESLNLVVRTKVKTVPPKTIIKLTEKGQKLAYCIKDTNIVH